MNWEAIGAIGEILGAVAVVATLFYLSRQMRQNSASLDRANDYAQAGSIQGSNALNIEVFKPLVSDLSFADIYDRALKGEALDSSESIRFSAFVHTYLVWAEDLYFQQETQLGFAVVGDTELLLATIGPYMITLLKTQAGADWWDRQGANHLSPDFYDVVASLLERSSDDA